MLRKITIALSTLALASCATAAPPKRHAVAPAPAPPPISTSSPLLWAGLVPGPKPVGFRSFLMRVQASEFHHGAQHLVQVNVWFPTYPGSGTPMTFRDYILPEVIENTYNDPTDADNQAAINAYMQPLISAGVSQSTIDTMLNAPMYARFNGLAPGVVKKSPMVFLGNDIGQSAPDQAVLGEFLASHDFIVISTPSITRYTGPIASDDTFGVRAEEQQDDMDRVISQISAWPSSVIIPVSVIGYGFTADAAILYAMNPHQPTNALVLIDPDVTPSRTAQLQATPMWNPQFKLAPILEIVPPSADTKFVQSLYTAEMSVKPVPMRHNDFTTTGFAAAAIPEIARKTGAAPNIGNEVRTAAQDIVTFLDRVWAPTRPPI